MPVVIARITAVVGPGAKVLLPLARAIDAGRFRLIGDGANHIDLAALADLVAACAGAQRCPARMVGATCLEAASRLHCGPSQQRIARSLGRPAPGVGPPAEPYRVLMHTASLVFRTTRYHSTFAHDREMLVTDKTSSSARARTDLGYETRRSLDAAIDEMIAQFIAAGWLRPSVPLERPRRAVIRLYLDKEEA